MEDLEQFWVLVVEVWNSAFFGVSVGKAAAAVVILFLFVVLRRVIARFVLANVKLLAKRTEHDLDDRLIDALEEPIKLAPIVLGLFLAGQSLELEGMLNELLINLVRSLIVFALFWGLYRVVEPLSVLLDHLERLLTRPLINWMVRAMKALFVLTGAAAILEIWGIAVAPIIAGAGLFGVAVALGAQDMFKNLIAGISIIIERRFAQGDWIKVDGVVEGTVETIGFRSTMVRQFDKAEVYVPNAKLSDDAVVNFTKMTHRRIYWMVGVEYRTTIDQLRKIRDGIEAYILESDEFAHPPEVSTFVRIDRFNDSSIDLMIYCFTKTTVWGDWLEIKERLAYEIMRIVEDAGSAFAFPSQSLYIESYPPGDRPEVFVPPRET
jgi:MscS family membrane protein